MKGLIFDIQRSSFVDGEGVRTAVFFKGCNLKCRWCHNPEGISPKKQMLFYKSKCKGCEKCKQICAQEEKQCTFCGECTIMCPYEAREVCGKEYDVSQLLNIILKDCPIYEKSGGGVTFSGGECMLQIDFLVEILKACKEQGINTAIDTAGNVPFSYFERVLPYVDTFLYDIKCINSELHKEYTGSTNHRILSNFVKLCKKSKKVVVRVPVIGGFNDTKEEISQILQFLKGKNIEKVEILRYHNMGAHKCEGAGVPFYEFVSPNENEINEIKEMFKEI